VFVLDAAAHLFPFVHSHGVLPKDVEALVLSLPYDNNVPPKAARCYAIPESGEDRRTGDITRHRPGTDAV
jgi:hypothetical protein